MAHWVGRLNLGLATQSQSWRFPHGIGINVLQSRVRFQVPFGGKGPRVLFHFEKFKLWSKFVCAFEKYFHRVRG